MALTTFSAFYYLQSVDGSNNKINFDEGGGELTATLNNGSYTVTEFVAEVKSKMDAVGGQEYTVSFNRTTRIITISAASNFDLLISSGTNSGQAAWTLLGYTGGVDLTGANSYIAPSACGSEFLPQYILQDHVDKENFRKGIQTSVHETTTGEIEVVTFAQVKFIEFSIKFQTNIAQAGLVINNDPSGVANLQAFMNHCIDRAPVEFMEDKDTRASFVKIRLERTDADSKGTSYKLKEMYNRGLPFYFETGRLTWRVFE